mmetsp:Transcript_53714/g.127972  ORF Transcript_53714/g.127972 Transcript_53714/m.127972 type:complete len:1109 (+) Transcript_53714:85-3411(+)
MQVPGQVVFNLYQELEKVKASLGAVARSDGAGAAVKAAIDKAEHALRERAVEARLAALQAHTNRSGSATPEAWPPRPPPQPHAGQQQQQPRRAREKGVPPRPPEDDVTLLRRDPKKFLNKKSGVEVISNPKRPGRCGGSAGTGTRRREKTAGPHRPLPRQNRLDPLAEPPDLVEEDLDSGLYSLSTRGFIPHMADLTPAIERGVPAVSQRPAPACPKGSLQTMWGMTSPGYLAMVQLERANSAPLPDGDEVFSPEETSLAIVPAPPRSTADPPYLGQGGRRQTSPMRRNRAGEVLPPLNQEGQLALPAPPKEGECGSATFYTELVEGGGGGHGEKLPDLPQPPALNLSLRRRSSWVMARADPRALRQRQEDAATLISSAWKGKKTRKEHKAQQKAAARIQRAWASARAHENFLQVIENTRQAEQNTQAALVKQLGSNWSERRRRRLVEIHVCSVYIPPHRRGCRQNLKALQASQVGRIFRVLDSQVDVVFVVPRRMHEEMLEYYSKIMQFRGVRNPPGRLQIIVPDAKDLPEELSLTQALLSSPQALLRLKRLVAGQEAYVVPGAALRPEMMLASQLKVPLMGLPASDAVVPHSKSAACRLVMLAGLPTPPTAGNIFSEEELYHSLTALIVQHREVTCWLLKLDDEREARGHAYLNMSSLRRFLAECGSALGPSEDAAAEGLDKQEVEAVLREQLPKKLVFCNRRAYADLQTWLVEASQTGALIQAVPDRILATTSVHIQIEPDQSIAVLGTSEAVHSQPFVTAADWYPATAGSWEVLCDVGSRMGAVLAGRGVLGFASIDVVFFETVSKTLEAAGHAVSTADGAGVPEQEQPSSQTIDPDSTSGTSRSQMSFWVVAVDPQLTDAASAMFPVQFISQTKVNQATGHLHMPDPPPPAGPHEEVARPPINTQRWALVSHCAHVDGLERLSHSEIFRHAKSRNVSYDLTHNVGCMFALIDVVHAFFSLIAVEETPEACARRLTAAVAAMSDMGQQVLQPPKVVDALLGLGPPAGSSLSMNGYAKPLVEVSMPRDAALPSVGDDCPKAPDYLTCAEVQTALRGCLVQHHDKQHHQHHPPQHASLPPLPPPQQQQQQRQGGVTFSQDVASSEG